MLPERYVEILQGELKAAQSKSEKLALVAEMKLERDQAVENPPYQDVFEAISTETDPEVIAALKDEAYTFKRVLTDEEKSAFDYVPLDYLEDNPGYTDEGEWISFIGSYPNPETGEYS